ncbi:MAG: cell division protein ZapA [Thalassotalea sp.]
MGKSAVSISINGRSLKVGCPSGEESALLAAAKELDNRLMALIATGHCSSYEQALLLTALNLTNDLLKQQNKSAEEKTNYESKVALLQSTIEQALIDQTYKQA